MTYWECSGKYQKESEKLEEEIPMLGGCSNKNLELFRISGNAYYDIHNNGACNGHIFKKLNDILSDYCPFESEEITELELDKLCEFLFIAQNEDRKPYLFEWGENQTSDQKEILDIFEKFMNWVVLTTYNKIYAI